MGFLETETKTEAAEEEIISIINTIYYLDATQWLISLIEDEIIILEKVESEQRIVERIQENKSEMLSEINNINTLLGTLEKPFTSKIRSWRITREQYAGRAASLDVPDGCVLSGKIWAEKYVLSCGLSFGWEETFGVQINSKDLLYKSICADDEEGVRRALARNKKIINTVYLFHRHSFFGFGATPLMIALREKKQDMVELLISEGADVTKKVGFPAKCALDIMKKELGNDNNAWEILRKKIAAKNEEKTALQEKLILNAKVIIQNSVTAYKKWFCQAAFFPRCGHGQAGQRRAQNLTDACLSTIENNNENNKFRLLTSCLTSREGNWNYHSLKCYIIRETTRVLNENKTNNLITDKDTRRIYDQIFATRGKPIRKRGHVFTRHTALPTSV